MPMNRRAPKPAPEKLPFVVQAEGWIKNTWHGAETVLWMPVEAARYLLSHGVVKHQADHESDKAAKEAREADVSAQKAEPPAGAEAPASEAHEPAAEPEAPHA